MEILCGRYLSSYPCRSLFCEPNILFHGAGAKGKFSGGFDITLFGGIQGGQCMFICDYFFILPAYIYILVIHASITFP